MVNQFPSHFRQYSLAFLFYSLNLDLLQYIRLASLKFRKKNLVFREKCGDRLKRNIKLIRRKSFDSLVWENILIGKKIFQPNTHLMGHFLPQSRKFVKFRCQRRTYLNPQAEVLHQISLGKTGSASSNSTMGFHSEIAFFSSLHLIFVIIYIPYARHYNPPFVYFYPIFHCDL